MAILVYELDETYSTITRPVTMSIIRQISKNLKITRDIPICYPGANGKLYTWNGGVQQSQDAANFHQQEKIQVQVKEDYHEDDLITMKGRYPNYNQAIFNDKETGIIIYPEYTRQKVNISFTYQARTRYQAESFRDSWRRSIAENREHMVFFAEYRYYIPTVIEQILYLLYEKRCTYRKQYPRFQDYIFDCFTDRLTVVTNAIGEGDVLAIEEVQQNIIGNFTDSVPGEAEKDDRGSVWTVSFDYEFHYDKVISMGIKYPISIDNQLVDPVLYPEVPYDLQYLKSQFMNNQRWNYDNIMNNMGWITHVRGAPIKIPEFDDWSIERQWNNYYPLVSALIIVDPEVPRDICNLKDLGDWGLHPALVPVFEKNHEYLNKMYEFPFYVSLYKDDVENVRDELHIASNLDIRTKHDMSVFNTYHLVIHGLRDVKMLSREGQKRFFSSPLLVNTWLDLVIGHTPEKGYPKVNSAGWVDIKSFQEVAEANGLHTLDKQDVRPWACVSPGRLLATVGIFSVVTHNQEEL